MVRTRRTSKSRADRSKKAQTPQAGRNSLARSTRSLLLLAARAPRNSANASAAPKNLSRIQSQQMTMSTRGTPSRPGSSRAALADQSRASTETTAVQLRSQLVPTGLPKLRATFSSNMPNTWGTRSEMATRRAPKAAAQAKAGSPRPAPSSKTQALSATVRLHSREPRRWAVACTAASQSKLPVQLPSSKTPPRPLRPDAQGPSDSSSDPEAGGLEARSSSGKTKWARKAQSLNVHTAPVAPRPSVAGRRHNSTSNSSRASGLPSTLGSKTPSAGFFVITRPCNADSAGGRRRAARTKPHGVATGR
mmetsp:Transcript_101376/g.327157  ORF Transcript_101376/g.327157 Transcript_101376/m.327157 type:complete len:306 (+) Transcript_101376:22-939(+)